MVIDFCHMHFLLEVISIIFLIIIWFPLKTNNASNNPWDNLLPINYLKVYFIQTGEDSNLYECVFHTSVKDN